MRDLFVFRSALDAKHWRGKSWPDAPYFLAAEELPERLQGLQLASVYVEPHVYFPAEIDLAVRRRIRDPEGKIHADATSWHLAYRILLSASGTLL